MLNRMLAVLTAVVLLGACDAPDAREDLPGGDPGALPAPAEGTGAAGEAAAVFVEDAPAAQVVVVGEEDMSELAGRTGAVFVPYSTFSVERDGIPNEFPPADRMEEQLEAAGVGGERILIAGEPIPAGRAYAALDYLGLGARAAIFEGAPSALPQAAAPRAAAAGELDVAVREGMIVDADWVHERLDDPQVVILDARPPEEYSGETPGEGIERPGHIPGARNVFWETLVESPDAPRLKDEAELRRIFEEAGARPGGTVVAYCRTGGQGSFLYAVARHLGYDARLYDGSYVDWSRTEYDVERGAGGTD